MATQALLLDNNAFGYMVAEHNLKTWEGGGYVYAAKREPTGELQLYRTYGPKWRWIWSYAQVCTQDNAGGGTLLAIITPATDSIMREPVGVIVASGNRAAAAYMSNSAGTQVALIANVGAVAGATACLQVLEGTNTASGANQKAAVMNIGGGSQLRMQVTSAAQTETATLRIIAVCSSSTAPTVSWAGSGGTPNAAAATINTMTPVLMP